MFIFIGVIDYNFLCFRDAIQQVFELRNKSLVLVGQSSNSESSLVNGKNTSLLEDPPSPIISNATN